MLEGEKGGGSGESNPLCVCRVDHRWEERLEEGGGWHLVQKRGARGPAAVLRDRAVLCDRGQA